MGRDFKQGFGGKGANQCVMAARLGVSTAMVSKVGDDVFGRETIANYRKNHVDVSHVTVTSDAPTGVAPIAVDDAGRNPACNTCYVIFRAV